ncbi:MAG TPA: hypothetical protein VMH80_22170 [Bryobacteraceae bacterium]|nr:hypothetical protein [Bryobacteraceae bacterium]
MRVASRIIGGLFIIGGLGFIGLAILLFTKQNEPGLKFVSLLIPLIIGTGLLLAGRYYWRMDVDAPEDEEEPKPPTPFVAAHRRELGVLAQAGLVLSLFRLIVLCLGPDVPGWAHWVLPIVCLGLLVIAPGAKAIPRWATQVLTFWFLALVLFVFLAGWHRSSLPSRLVENREPILSAGFFAWLYALEALSFAYCAPPASAVSGDNRA